MTDRKGFQEGQRVLARVGGEWYAAAYLRASSGVARSHLVKLESTNGTGSTHWVRSSDVKTVEEYSVEEPRLEGKVFRPGERVVITSKAYATRKALWPNVPKGTDGVYVELLEGPSPFRHRVRTLHNLSSVARQVMTYLTDDEIEAFDA